MADLSGMLESVSNSFNSGVGFNIAIPPVLMFWFKVFFWFTAVLMGLLIFYKLYLQYKIKVRVIIRSGGNIIDIKNDKAKLIEDEHGKKKLQLWTLKYGKKALTCPIPSQEYKYKSGKNDYYDLVLDDNFELHPNELMNYSSEDKIFVKPRPQELRAWRRMEEELINKKYTLKEKWKELLLPAMFIGTIVICFLILYFMFKEVGSGMKEIANAFAEVSKSCLR